MASNSAASTLEQVIATGGCMYLYSVSLLQTTVLNALYCTCTIARATNDCMICGYLPFMGVQLWLYLTEKTHQLERSQQVRCQYVGVARERSHYVTFSQCARATRIAYARVRALCVLHACSALRCGGQFSMQLYSYKYNPSAELLFNSV